MGNLEGPWRICGKRTRENLCKAVFARAKSCKINFPIFYEQATHRIGIFDLRFGASHGVEKRQAMPRFTEENCVSLGIVFVRFLGLVQLTGFTLPTCYLIGWLKTWEIQLVRLWQES